MALRDVSCYTLTIEPSSSDPSIVELVETSEGRKQPRYARVREAREGEAYSSVIYGEWDIDRRALGCATSTMGIRCAEDQAASMKTRRREGRENDGDRVETARQRAHELTRVDYLSGAKLASVGYATEKGKQRRLQLHGPDEDVPFDFSGKLYVLIRHYFLILHVLGPSISDRLIEDS
jgi:hypothetical protein